MAKAQDVYGMLLKQAEAVHGLALWAELSGLIFEDTKQDSRWAVIRAALNGADFFFGQLLTGQIAQEAGAVRFAGAQRSLGFVDDRPLTPSDLRAVVSSFLAHLPDEMVSIGKGKSKKPAADEADADTEPTASIDPGPDSILAAWSKAEPDRTLPPASVLGRFTDARPAGPEMGWSSEDRIAVADWAAAVISGQSPPKPEAAAIRYLEDMDLYTEAGRLELLDFVLRITVEDVYPDDHDQHPSHWKEKEWEEALSWATAAYRIERGETCDAESLPVRFTPTTGAVNDLATYFTSGAVAEGGVDELLSEDVTDPGFGIGLIVEALVVSGSVTRDGLTLRSSGQPMFDTEYLETLVIDIGDRQPKLFGGKPPEGAIIPLWADAGQVDEPAPVPVDDEEVVIDASAGVDASEGVDASAGVQAELI